MVFGVLEKNGLLIFDRQRFAETLVLLRQSAIQRSNFIGCS